MNHVFRYLIEIPTGVIKATINSIFYNANIYPLIAISPLAEISIRRGGQLCIQKGFRARSGSRIRSWKTGELRIGRNVSVNHGCIIQCRKYIRIGNDVQFSPNVLIYDHDHDYRADGGVSSMKYIESSVIIGNNVWIGANSTILRGTTIGDNCVIAAGSIVRGDIPNDTLFYNKRVDTIKTIDRLVSN